MSEAIVFISHSRIKEGAAGTFREMVAQMYPTLQETLPQTVVHLAYYNETSRTRTPVTVGAVTNS